MILALVAALGFTMFFVWLAQRRAATPEAATTTARSGSGPDAGAPAEQTFPVAIVTLHGILAVTTVLLVFLTAIGVGD